MWFFAGSVPSLPFRLCFLLFLPLLLLLLLFFRPISLCLVLPCLLLIFLSFLIPFSFPFLLFPFFLSCLSIFLATKCRSPLFLFLRLFYRSSSLHLPSGLPIFCRRPSSGSLLLSVVFDDRSRSPLFGRISRSTPLYDSPLVISVFQPLPCFPPLLLLSRCADRSSASCVSYCLSYSRSMTPTSRHRPRSIVMRSIRLTGSLRLWVHRDRPPLHAALTAFARNPPTACPPLLSCIYRRPPLSLHINFHFSLGKYRHSPTSAQPFVLSSVES